MLDIKDLLKIYKGRKVVNEVSLNVRKGEIVGLLGPNGAGKTTTFYMVVGVVKPERGKIFLNEKEITKIPMYRRAQLGIGYLSQEPSVFRKLTVSENILLVLEVMDLTKKERYKTLESLLEEFHISHLSSHKGFMLSGGERRRVEIARSLATNPHFLLLDEPFTGIDPIAVQDIKELISYLKRKNLGILATDHNVRDTLTVVDRAYIMHEGKILIEGDAETVAESEIAKKFYLGEKFRL